LIHIIADSAEPAAAAKTRRLGEYAEFLTDAIDRFRHIAAS
jgi:hypothetical protein